MATDPLHTNEVIAAIIAVLEGATGASHVGGLPTNWFADADDSDELPLMALQAGDLADYAADETLLDHSPGIFVRGLGVVPHKGGMDGVLMTLEQFRLVHIRHRDTCFNSSGGHETNMTTARNYYAKIIHQALFNDPNAKLAVITAGGSRTEATLTCADGAGAQVYNVVWTGWDLGADFGSPISTEEVRLVRSLPLPIWAIACNFNVYVRSGGDA